MRAWSTRSRSNVSSHEIVTGSCGSTTIGRSSMPRARRWSSSPTLPGSARASASASSAARSPISSQPASSQALACLRPHAGQEPQRERCEKRASPPGRDDHDASGLPPVARDLGHGLRAAGAERAAEPRRLAHRSLQRAEQRAGTLRAARSRRCRGSPRRCRPARRAGRSGRRAARPRASARGSARDRAARRRPADSGASPPPSSCPSRCRTPAPRSSPSRRRRGSPACRRRSSGSPRSSGWSSCSQAAKNASRSRCAIMRSRAARVTVRTAEMPGAKASLPA